MNRMNIYEKKRLDRLAAEHAQIIGLLINGCRYARPYAYDEYLRATCDKLPAYAWDMDIHYPILRRLNIVDSDYSDEQLSDLLALLRASYRRFHPADPLIRIAGKKRMGVKQLVKRVVYK